MWQPTDWFWYRRKVSPLGCFYLVAALPCLLAYPSAFAGVCLLTTAAVQQKSFRNGEAGDGGRSARAAFRERTKREAEKKREAAAAKGQPNDYPVDWYCLRCPAALPLVRSCAVPAWVIHCPPIPVNPLSLPCERPCELPASPRQVQGARPDRRGAAPGELSAKAFDRGPTVDLLLALLVRLCQHVHILLRARHLRGCHRRHRGAPAALRCGNAL